jgi:putative transposase
MITSTTRQKSLSDEGLRQYCNGLTEDRPMLGPLGQTRRGSRPGTLQRSARQRPLFRPLRNRQTASVRLARRVAVLLALAADPCLESVAPRLGLTRASVRLWRDRWRRAAGRLRPVEADGPDDRPLLPRVDQLLADAPRPGRPATFSPEQIVQIVALACEPPEKSGRPITHWTSAEVADEARKRQLVKRISPRPAGRSLKGGGPPASQGPPRAQRHPARPRGVPRAVGGGLRPV